MSTRVLIIAGEASGDAQGARLAAAMSNIDPSLHLYGMGGDKMRRAGVRTLVDAADLSIMGLSEVIGGLGRALGAYRMFKRELRSSLPPDLLVLVDFPEFNLALARIARRSGVPVVYYVSPQVWAWRRGRVRILSRRVDRMLVIFPFETEIYRQHGVDVHFVGHPLAEEVAASRTAEETRRMHGLSGPRPLVALLPGSRGGEVRQMLPVMLETARLMVGKADFVVAKAPGLEDGLVGPMVEESGLDIAIVEDDTYDLLAASDVAAVTSGTATVECALLGTPMVVAYRMSAISFAVARMLVKVPFIAMPNIILNEEVVPELIQSRATAENLQAALEGYIEDPERREAVSRRLAGVGRALVRGGAAEKAARLALEAIA